MLNINDQWIDSDNAWYRDILAVKYLRGEGLEIGALHKPTQLASETSVRYVDYKTKEENINQYPELCNESIINTDLVDDGFILSKVLRGSQNFIIANHVLEHSPDPIGTLKLWIEKICFEGCVFVTVPIGERCFDKGRPTTSLDHLINDHQLFSQNRSEEIINITKSHVREFIDISGQNIRTEANLLPATVEERQSFLRWLMDDFTETMMKATDYKSMLQAHIQLINLRYDIHYHTFSPTSFLKFLKYVCSLMGCTVLDAVKSGGGEVVGIIQKQEILNSQ